jgi:hypothetical protein
MDSQDEVIFVSGKVGSGEVSIKVEVDKDPAGAATKIAVNATTSVAAILDAPAARKKKMIPFRDKSEVGDAVNLALLQSVVLVKAHLIITIASSKDAIVIIFRNERCTLKSYITRFIY